MMIKKESLAKQPFMIQKHQIRGMLRRIDSLGRFVITSEYRAALEIKPDQMFEIFLTEDGIYAKAVKEPNKE